MRYGNLVLMTAPRGRPFTGNAREKVLPVRLSGDEMAELQAAADQDGKKTSDYVRTVALRDARAPRRHKKD